MLSWGVETPYECIQWSVAQNSGKKSPTKYMLFGGEKIWQTIRKHSWENKVVKIRSYTMRNNRLKDAEIEEI